MDFIGKEKGFCTHRGAEARLDCFHSNCDLIKVFTNNRLLLKNVDGYVRAFNHEEVRVIA